ncbi:hypothetical protein BDW02DRAFT_644110 [Decorospora gaudefroyi]|uniref:Uncharacterized protein n=1 Tax=Decorospora gaudefroyi TaxID=184978 RepID=A0A6A5KS30_9PLEO|nr:hypothetical protein BDW02DRAFT_644110 [Decorospora gaudefroyi]
MPPKKAATNGDASDASGPFKWEGPNDTKLLLLTQGRYVKPDEYPKLSTAFPGTSTGSIRNRISALRVKQRDMYADAGWELPEGGAGHSAKKAAAPARKKRNADADGSDEVQTPSKKPRAKRVKKDKVVKKEEQSDDPLQEGESADDTPKKVKKEEGLDELEI